MGEYILVVNQIMKENALSQALNSGGKMVMIPFCLMFILLLCPPVKSAASSPVHIDQDFLSLTMKEKLEVFIDQNGDMTINQVEEASGSDRFIPFAGRLVMKYSNPQSATWYRFKLHKTQMPRNWASIPLVLELNFNTPKEFYVYIPNLNKEQKYKVLKTGWGLHDNLDELKTLSTAFTLPGSYDHERYFFVQLKHPVIQQTSLSLYSQEVFLQKNLHITALVWAGFGILLAMILFNLFTSIFLKENAYYLYVTYITMILFHQLAYIGGLKLVSIPLYNFFSSKVITFGSLSAIMALLFTRSFLKTRDSLPWMNKLIWACVIIQIIIIAFDFAGFHPQANQASLVLGLLMPILLFSVAIIRIRQGFISAIYYLTAWSMLWAGIIVFTLNGLGVIEGNEFANHSLLLGSALESVLLSLALAYRVKEFREQHEVFKKKERRLKELTITDELTNLYNKRWFSSKLESEIDHASSMQLPLSLIILDADHFKKFNDTYGHAAGDEILAKLGKNISESLRDTDIPCRYGGEEFAIILPGIDMKDALITAERLRKKVQSQRFKTGLNKNIKATISLGVATLKDSEKSKSLFERADKALYRAKELGRNRTVSG